MELGKEYYFKPYYFLLERSKDKYYLTFSYGENLNETKKKDEKIEFDGKHLKYIKSKIDKIIKSKKPKSLQDLKKELEQSKEELGELVDSAGNLKSSKIPVLNMRLTPRKTTDQTVPAATIPNNPVTRGYRKYYGESKENEDDTINEVDFSDAFGYEETKDMDGKKTFKYLVKNMEMAPDEAVDRTKQFGKDPFGKKTKKAPERIRKQKGFIDRMTLAEKKKEEMKKLVDEILLGKKTFEKELEEKESDKKVPTIIQKNVSVLKKMAEKHGLTINQLIKLLKGE